MCLGVKGNKRLSLFAMRYGIRMKLCTLGPVEDYDNGVCRGFLDSDSSFRLFRNTVKFFLIARSTTRFLRIFPKYPIETSYSPLCVTLVPLSMGSRVTTWVNDLRKAPRVCLKTSFLLGSSSAISVNVSTFIPLIFALAWLFCPSTAKPGGSIS